MGEAGRHAQLGTSPQDLRELMRSDAHWENFHGLVSQHGLRGNDIRAYLAALALEQGAKWVTTAFGLARYEGMRLLDPLAAGPLAE
jgi:hypothetical protein